MTKDSGGILPVPPPAHRLGRGGRGEGSTLEDARKLSAENKGAQHQNEIRMREAKKIIEGASASAGRQSPLSTPKGKSSKAQEL
jgi:hypothetical protein